MKRYFIFATAAIALLAGCNKSNPDDVRNVENESPVAIELGVNAPSITVTKTKAAVNKWNNNNIFVYGLKQERTSNVVNAFGSMYDFESEDNILGTENAGYSATATSNEDTPTIAPLTIYKDEDTKVPYYYVDGQTYDFFGYHLGGAKQGEITAQNDVVSFPVTIDGSNDVMYAYTDKSKDLEDFTPKAGETATVADLYSSWAVRRGVDPTLVFTHALTRFNFIVKGVGSSYETVQIQNISVSAVEGGTLTVVGQLPVTGSDATPSTIGYTYDAEETAVSMVLKDAADGTIAPTMVTANADNAPFGGEGASLMVPPGLASLPVVVTMKNQVAGMGNDTADDDIWSGEYKYEFNAPASSVVNGEVSANLTTFAAGAAYNIYINVYGPEAIKITAELTEWKDGGKYTYDPDDAFRPGTGSTTTTETVSVTPVVPTESEEAYNAFYGDSSAPEYDATNPTYPWIGFKIGAFDEDVTLNVKCFNGGEPVAFNEPFDGVWYTRSTDNYTAVVPFEQGKTIVSFEAVSELGLTGDLSKVTFEVTKTTK